jgi:hypothetical protein
MSIPKNTAGSREAIVFYDLTTGAPMTSGTPTGVRQIDGGAQAAVTGTYAHLGSGHWVWTRSAADTNGDHIGGVFLLAGAYAVPFDIWTRDAQLDLIGVEVADRVASGVEGTVMASPVPTTTSFKLEGLATSLASFADQFVEFRSGALKGVARPIATYGVNSATTGTVTIATALDSTPAVGVRVAILGYGVEPTP